MGKRRLAYTVRRLNDGIFVLLVIEGTGAIVHEVERRLRVTEQVIKFITVRTDEELKRLDKIKKLRDARKKTSAAPAAPGPTPGGGRRAGFGDGLRPRTLGGRARACPELVEGTPAASLRLWIREGTGERRSFLHEEG